MVQTIIVFLYRKTVRDDYFYFVNLALFVSDVDTARRQTLKRTVEFKTI